MKVFAGTSGYSYKEWKGNFYPERLPSTKMLQFYAERLPTVEINNTFYRLPKVNVLESWREQVPDEFRFVLKASRRITHDKRLKEADELTEYLLRTVQTLGIQLGVILFQLPPYLRKDVSRLDRFLSLLPDSPLAAFEFRHESWFDEEVFGLLRARNFALCVADTDDQTHATLVHTADWGYVRLRRTDYCDQALADWAKRLQMTGWNQVYVFFKHEDEGAGPKFAARFLELTSRSPSP